MDTRYPVGQAAFFTISLRGRSLVIDPGEYGSYQIIINAIVPVTSSINGVSLPGGSTYLVAIRNGETVAYITNTFSAGEFGEARPPLAILNQEVAATEISSSPSLFQTGDITISAGQIVGIIDRDGALVRKGSFQYVIIIEYRSSYYAINQGTSLTPLG